MNKLKMMGELLEQQLTGFKFSRSKLKLVKKTDAGSIAIPISLLSTSTKGIQRFASVAQVRIDELENIYAIHSPHFNPKNFAESATVVANCDELFKDESFVAGFRVDEDTMVPFIDDYSKAVRSDVLPWLEKYSSEQNLLEGLINNCLLYTSPSPRDRTRSRMPSSA